jgi:hypothetical protein
MRTKTVSGSLTAVPTGCPGSTATRMNSSSCDSASTTLSWLISWTSTGKRKVPRSIWSGFCGQAKAWKMPSKCCALISSGEKPTRSWDYETCNCTRSWEAPKLWNFSMSSCRPALSAAIIMAAPCCTGWSHPHGPLQNSKASDSASSR